MDRPQISIIVPVYKSEKFLARCVESILNQTFTNFELILIDDKSPDDSGKMCDELVKQDSRIRAFHLDKNSGPSAARNYGLDRANGHFITFIDSDDWVDVTFLEKLHTSIVEFNCDIMSAATVYTETYEEPSNAFSSNSDPIILTGEEALIDLFTRESITMHVPWGKLFRAELFTKEIRFPEDILLEDVLTTYRLVQRSHKVGRINSTRYYYFQGSDSITRGHFDPRYLQSILHLSSIRSSFDHPSFKLQQAIDHVEAMILVDMVNRMIADGGYKKESRDSMKRLAQNSKSLLNNQHTSLRQKAMLLAMHMPNLYEALRKISARN